MTWRDVEPTWNLVIGALSVFQLDCLSIIWVSCFFVIWGCIQVFVGYKAGLLFVRILNPVPRMSWLLRVDYISGGLYQLKMCKRAGTMHISCSGSYLIVPFIHVFRVPFVWHLSRLFVSLFKDSSRTLLPSVLLPWTEVSSTSYFYLKEQ